MHDLHHRELLLVDVRPSHQFCSGHIRGAENVNFSNVLLQRLLEGVVKLETVAPDLTERMCRWRNTTQLVLCDTGSSSHRLLKHAEVFVNCLRERDGDCVRHSYMYVDGGYSTFSQKFPEMCDNSDSYGLRVEILPHLILGCAKDSSDLSTLQKLGVNAVLNLSRSVPSLFQNHLQYLEIRVCDNHKADLLSRLDEACSFIDNVKTSGGRVLVHCRSGVS